MPGPDTESPLLDAQTRSVGMCLQGQGLWGPRVSLDWDWQGHTQAKRAPKASGQCVPKTDGGLGRMTPLC